MGRTCARQIIAPDEQNRFADFELRVHELEDTAAWQTAVTAEPEGDSKRFHLG